MTYRELVDAAKNNEPLEQEPTWFQEQIMAFARGWRGSPVHYCVAIVVGVVLLGILLVRLSVPGHVRVETSPDGAKVIVDGREMGATPLVLKDVGRGDHKLELVKPGFEPMQAYFGVSAGAPSSYQFALRRLAPAEPPLAVASAAVQPRGPAMAMADTTPTSSLADEFRGSRGMSHTSKASHRKPRRRSR